MTYDICAHALLLLSPNSSLRNHAILTRNHVHIPPPLFPLTVHNGLIEQTVDRTDLLI